MYEQKLYYSYMFICIGLMKGCLVFFVYRMGVGIQGKKIFDSIWVFILCSYVNESYVMSFCVSIDFFDC